MSRQRYEHIIYEQLNKTEEGRVRKEEETIEKNFTIGYIMFSSICVFVLSITDISFSYLNEEKCQSFSNKGLDLSLNIWLRVNGIFSIIYYVLLLISFWNRKKIVSLDNVHLGVESLLLITSLFSIVWLGIGTYTFLTMKCLQIYMWTRVVFGFLFHIPNMIYIGFYMF